MNSVDFKVVTAIVVLFSITKIKPPKLEGNGFSVKWTNGGVKGIRVLFLKRMVLPTFDGQE
jgi:hypothetical protein